MPADTLTHQRKTNFSIAAIMSGIQASVAKTEPLDTAEESSLETKAASSDESSDNLPALDKTVTVKKEKRSKISEECHCEDLAPVTCSLDNKELWDKFCEFGTEMIITRSGRRMFPTVRCSFANLEAEAGVRYLILLDIVPCDNKRYRYAYHRSSWLARRTLLLLIVFIVTLMLLSLRNS